MKATWGKRCDILLFMSSVWDPSLPSVKLDLIHDDRTRLWQKSREAFKYVYKHYRNQADWFLKADDDTFVVMENLRYFLRDHQPSKPIYFGYRLQNKDLIKLPDKPSTMNKDFASGGAGYVLSKEALGRFINIALQGKNKHGVCNHMKNMGNEDIEVGHCLESVGVRLMPTIDQFGKIRFHKDDPTRYSNHKGSLCCSNRAISFHHLSPERMVELENILYDLKPNGDNSKRYETINTDILYTKKSKDLLKNLSSVT